MIDEAALNDVRAVAAARRGCGGRKQAGITQGQGRLGISL